MNKQQRNGKPHNTGFRRNYFENGRYAGEVNRYGVFDMKQQCNSSQQRFRNGAERHANGVVAQIRELSRSLVI